LGLFLFVAIEGRVRTPILPIGLLLHNRSFALSNLAAMINYSATFAVSFFLSLYLQNVKGMSPRSAGLVLVVQPVVQAALSPACGKLSDRVEPRVLASLGMSATALGLVVLVGVSADTQLWYVAASLALLGGGFALFSSPNTNAVLSSVGADKLGVANAMLATMRTVGMTFSMALALLLQALLASKPLVAVQRTSFLVCAILCFAGIFASLARGNVREAR
jgi:predicted MFS family arabinose efflux permease